MANARRAEIRPRSLIDEPRLLFAEGRLILHLDVAELLRRRLDRRRHGSRIRPRRELDHHQRVELLLEELIERVERDDVVRADEAVLRERAADHERHLPDGGERRGDRVADLPALVGHHLVEDHDLAVLEARDRLGGQLQRRHVVDRRGVDPGDERRRPFRRGTRLGGTGRRRPRRRPRGRCRPHPG